MNKQQIIEAIKALANDATVAPAQRQQELYDIEFAAQDAREKLEDQYSDD